MISYQESYIISYQESYIISYQEFCNKTVIKLNESHRPLGAPFS